MPEGKYGKQVFWIASTASLVIYILTSYLTPRHDSPNLVIQYTVLFGAFILVYNLQLSDRYLKSAYLAGFLFRLSLLFLVPNLSDDVYRFIWDGRLTLNGINPYAFLPEEILSSPGTAGDGLTPSLFEFFGKNTHSSYPPFNQLIFAVAALIFPDSVYGSLIVIRLIILVFETGNILLIQKLLRESGKPARLGLLYVLNPLVILELTGNLHLEGIMVFFLLLAIRYIGREKYYFAGIALGLGILTKLLPLLLLPYLWAKYRENGIRMIATGLLITLAGFLPLLGILSATGFLESLALYFYKLEFNASIYFLVRQIGYWVAGFNIIWVAGPVLGLLAAVLIIIYSVSGSAKKKETWEVWMWLLIIYLAFTTTLHPWYIITPLALSLFTPFRFPVVWSYFIFLTYTGYTETGYVPDYWLIGLEYAVVYAFMIWEFYKRKTLRNEGVEGLKS